VAKPKLKGQHYSTCLGGPRDSLDPLWILAFDPNGYLASDSVKFFDRSSDPVLVDSFLQ